MRVFIKLYNVKIILFVCSSFLCLYFIQNVLFCVECDSRNQININSESKSTESSELLNKKVTKSLSDLKRLSTLNEHILMFNYGRKTGSEMFILILKWLQGPNNFKHFRLGSYQVGKWTSNHQKQMTEFVSKMIRDLATPVSFDAPSYFTNFPHFTWDNPTHFGVVRDPGEILRASSNVDNLADQSYANQLQAMISNIQTISPDLNIPYFCGHEPKCAELNNEWALQRAKENVKKFYAVVGVMENLDETLLVLEKRLKYFFKGAVNIYQKKFLKKHNEWKENMKIKGKVFKEIEQILSMEYEFYTWIKSRLFDQATLYETNQQEIQTEKINSVSNIHFQVEEP